MTESLPSPFSIHIHTYKAMQPGGDMYPSKWSKSVARRIPTVLLMALPLCGSGPAYPQQPGRLELVTPPAASPATAPLQLLSPYPGATLEKYFTRLRIDFKQLDADLDGKITQRDVDLHAFMEARIQRTYALMFVMYYDLDGDGAVAEDEIRRAMKYDLRSSLKDPEKQTGDTVRSIMALDTDKDGKVSVIEAGKFTNSEMQRSLVSYTASGRARDALTLDSSNRGEITLQDFEAAGEVVFGKVDTDHDGKISPQEFDDYRRTR